MNARTRRLAATSGGAATVVAIQGFAGRALLGDISVPTFCDHLYKFGQQQAFSSALASGRDPLGWLWQFSGGHPELQFYPPGAAALGAGFDLVPGVDAPTAYWLVLVVAWFLPGIAAFTTLRIAEVSVPVSALGATLVGTLVFGYAGTFAGVGFGVLAVRLSAAAFVLATGLFIGATREGASRRARAPWLVGVALSVTAATLFHLYFVPFFGSLVGWWLLRSWRRRADGGAAAVRAHVAAASAALAGVALAGTWWAGAVLLRGQSVPYRASNSIVGLGFVFDPELESGIDWYLLVAGFVASLAVLRRDADTWRARLVRAIVPLAAVELVVIVFDRLLGVPLFPANRTFDFIILWLAVTAPLGLDAVLTGPANRLRLVLAACTVGAVWLVLGSPSILPGPINQRFPAGAAHGPTQLWDALRDGTGRVAFTSAWISGGSMAGYTPFAAGREAVNGGPVVGSPMQRNVVAGPGAVSIESFEFAGDVSMFGIRWDDAARAPAVLAELHQRMSELGITQIVADPTQVGAATVRAALASDPARFRFVGEGEGFAIFEVVGAVGGRASLAEGRGTVTTREDDGTFTIDVTTEAGGSVALRANAGPYWQVRVDGAGVTPDQNRWGEMIVRLPEPGQHEVVLAPHTPGPIVPSRIAAVTLSAACLAFALRLRPGSGSPTGATTG